MLNTTENHKYMTEQNAETCTVTKIEKGNKIIFKDTTVKTQHLS